MPRFTYRLFLLGLVVATFACSSGPTRRTGAYAVRNPVVSPGGRIAVVLEKSDGCNPTTDPYFSTSPNGANVFPGQQNRADAFGQQRPTGQFRGQRGFLEILSLNESDIQSPRANGSSIGAGTPNQYITSGILPRSLGGLDVPGLGDGSYTVADRSGLVVTSVTDWDQVWVTPVYPNGAPGSTYSLYLGSHPRHISIGDTPMGRFGLVATDQGFGMFALRGSDEYGMPVAKVVRNNILAGNGRAISSAFFGEYAILGLAQGAVGNNGMVAACSLRAQQEAVSPLESSLESPHLRARGCFQLDASQMARYAQGPYTSNLQRVMGIPTRLAVSENQLMALTGYGPINLGIPNIPGMEASLDSYYRQGPLQNFGRTRGGNMAGSPPKDMVLLPFQPGGSKTVAVLRGNDLEYWAMDNALEQGSLIQEPFRIGTDPVALSVDPGPDPTMLAIADHGSARVYIALLDDIAAGLNVLTDYVRTRACPIAVSIRGRLQ
ncbi:MAG: hypothetical protein V1798_04925 [Pseudomonadota bacterium]